MLLSATKFSRERWIYSKIQKLYRSHIYYFLFNFSRRYYFLFNFSHRYYFLFNFSRKNLFYRFMILSFISLHQMHSYITRLPCKSQGDFDTFPQQKYIGIPPYTKKSLSIEHCCAACVASYNCTLANYNSASEICQLINDSIVYDSSKVEQNGNWMILKTNYGSRLVRTLTHFSPISQFYTPWKRQKTFGFLTFSGGIEMWHWTKMG